MHPDAPHFIILLCLIADNFTDEEESAATQWVKKNTMETIIYSVLFFTDNRPASATPKATNHNKQNAPRRSLNLEDYKKRRGLI
jgi:hypothetical protein